MAWIRSPLDRSRFALVGEARAEQTLRRAGWKILARRYRTRRGEIDLVALDGDVVVFVEVKARRSVRHGRPAEAVRRAKRGRIADAALAYLQAQRMLDCTCRFDVVEVVEEPGAETIVRHIRDAFRE